MKESLFTTIPPARTGYGIDLSDRFVAVVRVRAGRSQPHEEVVLATVTDNPAATLQPVLEQIAAEVARGHAWVCAGMPVRQSSLRWLTAPFASVPKARRVLPSLLDIQLPFPLERCVYGFPVIESGTEVRALALAAPRQAVERRLEECRRYGVDPHLLAHEGLALAAALPPTTAAPDHLDWVIYLGIDRTVWVAAQQGRILASQVTQIGIDQLDADPARAEWRERALRFYRTVRPASKQGPGTIHWTGPGAAEPARIVDLEPALIEGQDLTSTISNQPEAGLARAFAHQLMPAARWTWNFRAGDFAHPAVIKRAQSLFSRLALTALIGGLLLIAAQGLYRNQVQQRNAIFDTQLRSIAERLTALPHVPRGQEVMLAERAIEEQAGQIQPFERALSPSLTMRWAHLLEMAKEAAVDVEALDLETNRMRIRGTANHRQGPESLRRQLAAEGWTADVTFRPVSGPSFLRFTLTAERID